MVNVIRLEQISHLGFRWSVPTQIPSDRKYAQLACLNWVRSYQGSVFFCFGPFKYRRSTHALQGLKLRIYLQYRIEEVSALTEVVTLDHLTSITLPRLNLFLLKSEVFLLLLVAIVGVDGSIFD